MNAEKPLMIKLPTTGPRKENLSSVRRPVPEHKPRLPQMVPRLLLPCLFLQTLRLHLLLCQPAPQLKYYSSSVTKV